MAQPTVTVTLQDGSTTFTLTVPTGVSSARYIGGLIKTGFVTPGDGVTFYPMSWVKSLVASGP